MGQKRRDLSTERGVVEISIPTHILDRVDERLPRTSFNTRDRYIAYVLAEILARIEDASDDEYESVNQNEVESRLESLGYLE
jgi:metal-responsive CopG/Arc/MetJ family transcriptional regulator